MATEIPVPLMVNAADEFSEPALPNSCSRIWVPSVSTLRTSASVPLLLIVPVTGVSEISINSATAPNVP